MPNRKKVAIIMGSDSDWPVVKSACGVLKDFDVPFEAHILSAHRTPEAAAAFAKSARANGYGVILCAAGMAAHLAGAFAANTTLPVVGIPMSLPLSWISSVPTPPPPLPKRTPPSLPKPQLCNFKSRFICCCFIPFYKKDSINQFMKEYKGAHYNER